MQETPSNIPDFQKLFESAPDVYLILSPDFKIIGATEERLRVTKTKRSDIIGKDLFEVFPDNPDDPNATGVANLKASLNRVVENKTTDAMAPQKYDIPRPESEGGGFEERYWSPVNSPVLDEKGNLLYIIHRVEDITELVLMKKRGAELETRTERMESEIILRAQQLQDANKKLREAEKLKSEFFANVSHELRTPLSLILAPLESILSGSYGSLNNEQIRSLQILHNNAIRLLQMVNGLLDFAKFEAGKMNIEREPVNIFVLINSILHDFESMIGSKKLNLSHSIEYDEKQVLIDRYLLERILFNLLSNAIKFTPEHGNIHVTSKITGNILEISVKDSGLGISEENIKTLFEKFRQVEGSSTRRFEGTGLGLAMVKEFTELLDGNVSLESKEGKGSTFTIQLPIQITDEKEKNSKKQTLLPRYDLAVSELKTNENEKDYLKVLICEDNEELSSYIVSLLSTFCSTKTAKDGEEGWSLVKEWSPDLVLSDVMMPKKDGVELCRQIKSDPETLKIKVVLLTALTHRDAMLRGWEAKADEYLFKPFHPDELVTRIRSLLSIITEKKKVAAEIDKYIHELEITSKELSRSNNELSQFAYVASHDLQEPLRTISNFASLLEEKSLENKDHESEEYLKFILNAASRMRNLISDLLEFSMVGRNITFEPFNCNKLIDQVLADMNASITKKFAKVSYSGLPILIGNEVELKRLFQNLISNAIKFQLPDRRSEIEIKVEEKEDEYLFMIKDNGVGIDEKYIPKLFVIFQRLHSTDEFPGTGIGLATCKKIVSLHNGKIWVESKKGEGSVFFFTISKKISSRVNTDVKSEVMINN